MLLEVLVADMKSVWRYLEVYWSWILRILGFWRKILLSSAATLYLETAPGLLLGFSGKWILDHEAQGTMWTEVSIRNYVISERPTHKVGCTQQQLIIKCKWYICDWSCSGPEGISYMGSSPGTHCPYSCYPTCNYGLIGIISWQEKKIVPG